ncbi:MAG: FAD-dependent oxidoreductase [Candidatus Velthaea sp.]|jgi:dihydrolipoamide dehydrogenase
MHDFDVAIVGTGQGGVPLAIDLAAAGKRVVVFERGKLGGSCVNVGCTPSKAFLASAHAAGRARRAADIGVKADVRVDFPAVMERVRAVVADWNGGVEAKFAKHPAIELVRAEAAFAGPHTLAAAGEHYTAATIVVDTGTRPAIPQIAGIAGLPYLTNLTFFDQTVLPRRTLVIGGGYIGLELGQGLARCGSEVHIVHSAERVLTNEEPAVSAALQRSFARDGITLHLAATTTGVTFDGTTYALELADGSQVAGEALLVAAGRAPNIPAGAAAAGIALDARGYIAVDEHLRTSVPGVYALGDVAGQPQFTHVSWEDYRRLKAILGGDLSRTRADRVLGYAVFTDPQVGRVGLTHEAALQAGHQVRCVTLELENVARAIEWNETNGFYRMVVDTTSNMILGATLVGYEAGELVHVFLAHMEAGSPWQKLEQSVHIHPTYAEALPSLARLLVS